MWVKKKTNKSKYVVLIEINVGKEKAKKNKYVVVIEINVGKEKQICCRNRNQCGEAENNVLQPQKKCASVFFPPLPEIYVSTPKTGNIFQ